MKYVLKILLLININQLNCLNNATNYFSTKKSLSPEEIPELINNILPEARQQTNKMLSDTINAHMQNLVTGVIIFCGAILMLAGGLKYYSDNHMSPSIKIKEA